MITAKMTRGKTMTSVDTPNRQLKERDLAIASVLSAKSFRRVNAFPRRRLPGSINRPVDISAPRGARYSRAPPAVVDGITARGVLGPVLRRRNRAPRELVERKVR